MTNLYDYIGIIHIHSIFSFDGRIAVPDIIDAAKENGIDFLMLTDHSCLTAKEEGLAGWHGETLLIVGQEIAPRFNHYIVFNVDDPIIVFPNDEGIDPQTYVDQVRDGGGIGFIAHQIGRAHV
jgi:predicted metal-dependent phosphoesterase TrpH